MATDATNTETVEKQKPTMTLEAFRRKRNEEIKRSGGYLALLASKLGGRNSAEEKTIALQEQGGKQWD